MDHQNQIWSESYASSAACQSVELRSSLFGHRPRASATEQAFSLCEPIPRSAFGSAAEGAIGCPLRSFLRECLVRFAEDRGTGRAADIMNPKQKDSARLKLRSVSASLDSEGMSLGNPGGGVRKHTTVTEAPPDSSRPVGSSDRSVALPRSPCPPSPPCPASRTPAPGC